MNWTLIMAVALSLANPFYIGIAADKSQEAFKTQLDQVKILQDVQADVEVTQNVGAEGRTISVNFGGATRQVYFPAGALTREVSVTVKLSATPNTTYPGSEELRRSYPPELLKYISPLMTVELPLDALDWHNPDGLKGLLYLSPGFNEGAYNEDLLIRAELRYRLADDTEALGFDNYGLDEFVEIRAARLEGYFFGSPPAMLNLSIQIVDESALY